MKKIYVIVLISMIGLSGISQINSNSPAIPFGSKKTYSYGIVPTNLPTSGTYTSSQDAANAYIAWKTAFVRTCSNGSRVLFDDNSSTVSEGIAYGMLLAAYAGDKPLLDALWNFYKTHSNSNGVMNWKYSDCNNVTGSGGATDAEEDAAMALIVAETQWPNATSPYDYKAEATTLISKIRQFEVASSNQVVNGDGWGLNSTCRNPSYFAPAYYREYALVETSYASKWNSVTSTAQSFLLTNRNSTTGLVSNWADQNATPNTCNGGNLEFGWDAIRTPWRMATDVLWNGTATATTGADICNKMSAWANNYASNLKGPCALNASNPSVGSYKNGTFSMIALAFMGGGASYQSALNSAYTSTVGLGNNEAYFSCTLRCITLFMMTGNFWKPGGTTVTPPTATITPASSTTFCTGGSVVLNASTGSGYTYQWKKDNNNISGATSSSYTATTAGSYTVVVTANGQSATSSATVVTVNTAPTANAGNDVFICTGNSTTLTATGGGTYKWSTNATSASINVSPSSTTTYTVTVTSTGGCTATDQVIVNVSSLPTANAGNDVAICNGNSTTLTATGGVSYSWSNGTNSASNTVSPTTTTTYTVTVTNTGGCTATDQVVVTVNQVPTANAGNDVSICNGNSTTLTASGGGTYKWSTNATSASINVSPTSTTTYTVTVTSTGGCTAIDQVVVTVNQAPSANAGNDVSICTGNSTTLTATGGVSYKWSNNATSATITVNPASTTTYTVTVTGSNSCTATDEVVVTVNSIPVANAGNDVTICSGDQVTLTASGGTSYAWDNGINASTNIVSPSSTTTYTVTVSSGANCVASDQVVVTVNPVPASPVVSSPVSYVVGDVATPLTANGSDLLWYTVATGGTSSATAPTPSTAVDGTTSYYVTQTINSCESSRAKIDVVVAPAPPPVVHLKAGWNMIGCPISGSTNIANALSSVWSEVICVKNNNAFYYTDQPAFLNTLLKLNWGEGYMIKVKTDCDLDWIVR